MYSAAISRCPVLGLRLIITCKVIYLDKSGHVSLNDVAFVTGW